MIIISSSLPLCAHAETLTLEQALSIAYETSPRLESERASLRATDEDVATALSGWRPSLSVSGSYGVATTDMHPAFYGAPGNHPRDVTITLNQPVINGSTIAQTQQAKAEVRAGRAQLDAVEQGVLMNAARAYFDVTADEATLGYRRDNAELLANQLRMIQDRFNAGDVSRTDVELVRSRLTAANADASLALGKLVASRAEFTQAVGRPPETLEPAPALPAVPVADDQAFEFAVANNPNVIAARETALASEAAVDVARGALLPSLSLQGQYRTSHDEIASGINESALSIIAQLRVPLYQGGAEYAGVRKAKENRSKAGYAIADVERQVRQALDAARQAQIAAREAVTYHEQQVDAARTAYEGFAEGVRVGDRSTFDLLNSAQEVVAARISLAESRHQYYVATFDLLAAVGGLTAKGLKLPVKLYDPEEHYRQDATRWFGTGR